MNEILEELFNKIIDDLTMSILETKGNFKR